MGWFRGLFDFLFNDLSASEWLVAGGKCSG